MNSQLFTEVHYYVKSAGTVGTNIACLHKLSPYNRVKKILCSFMFRVLLVHSLRVLLVHSLRVLFVHSLRVLVSSRPHAVACLFT
jgi:hypothetical protein